MVMRASVPSRRQQGGHPLPRFVASAFIDLEKYRNSKAFADAVKAERIEKYAALVRKKLPLE